MRFKVNSVSIFNRILIQAKKKRIGRDFVMDIKECLWDMFENTGRIDAYLMHKNIGKRGETRNAGHKGYRNNYKAK